jgi:hypothetical protein
MTIPVVEHRRFCASETNISLGSARQRLIECLGGKSHCGNTRKGRGASSSSSSETVSLVDENIVPIDEAVLSQNHDLIHAIMNAKFSGPVMSSDEFKAWLDQR